MKIIVPMAGKGTRFMSSGHNVPKPLITVSGRPMFHWALDSIKDINYSSIYFTILAEHEDKFHVSKLIPDGLKSHKLKFVDKTPEGQLMSVMAHAEQLDTEEDILIISSDTLVISRFGNDIALNRGLCDGIISVANLPGDMWSFAKTDEVGRVVEVAEKKRISDNASTGMYYFSRGSNFIKYAKNVLASKTKVNGEYYVIPVYQEYINANDKIIVSQAESMWDMGNPISLEHFLKDYKFK